MKYEFGLANYFLHELGNNLCEDNILLKNENEMFDSKMDEEERIIREIDKIKSKSNKYDKYLDNKDNIKDIIVCIDLLLGIEVSFKSNFICIAKDILEDDRMNKIFELDTDIYEDTIKEADKVLNKVIKEYLDRIVHN